MCYFSIEDLPGIFGFSPTTNIVDSRGFHLDFLTILILKQYVTKYNLDEADGSITVSKYGQKLGLTYVFFRFTNMARRRSAIFRISKWTFQNMYCHIVSQIFISVEEQCTISVLNNGLLWTYYQENPSSRWVLMGILERSIA